jgi:hypothetical protein
MSRHTHTRARRASSPVVRPRGHRTRLIALTGVAALALAGTAAWMTSGASPMSTPSNLANASTVAAAPAAQQQTASTQASPATAPAPVSAAASAPHAAAPATATASTAPAGTSAPGTAGQQAFVDPTTGKLRPAEHDEVAALGAPTGARRLARTAQTAAEPQEFATEGGAMGIAVPDEVQPYTVATKTPDGRVVIEHVTGGKAAAAKVRANSKPGASPVSKASQPGKGEPNDR